MKNMFNSKSPGLSPKCEEPIKVKRAAQLQQAAQYSENLKTILFH